MKKLNLAIIVALVISLPAMAGLFHDIVPAYAALIPALEPFQTNEYSPEELPTLEEHDNEWMLTLEQPLADSDFEFSGNLEDELDNEWGAESAAAAASFPTSTLTQGAGAQKRLTVSEKAEIKKQKNRVSAAEYRKKKKELLQFLQAQNQALAEENGQLKNTLKDALEELKQLKSRLGDS